MTKNKIKVVRKQDFFNFTEYTIEVEGITFYIQREVGSSSYSVAGIRVEQAKALTNLASAFETLGLSAYPEVDNIITITNDKLLDEWDNQDEVMLKISEKLEIEVDYNFDEFMPLGNFEDWDNHLNTPAEDKPTKVKSKDTLIAEDK